MVVGLHGEAHARFAGMVAQGPAHIGQSFVSGCDNSGVPSGGVAGKGLHIAASSVAGPGKTPGGKAPVVITSKTAVYHFDTTAMVGGSTNFPSGPYALDLCGEIYPGDLGIGAACSHFMGYDGRGRLVGPAVYQISELTMWPAVGGLIGVYGHMQEVAPVVFTPVDEMGTVEGLMHLGGDTECVTDPKGGSGGMGDPGSDNPSVTMSLVGGRV